MLSFFAESSDSIVEASQEARVESSERNSFCESPVIKRVERFWCSREIAAMFSAKVAKAASAAPTRGEAGETAAFLSAEDFAKSQTVGWVFNMKMILHFWFFC